MNSKAKLPEMANAIRFLAIDAVQSANSGHPGLPMGAADIATVLFTEHMKFDPGEPEWPDRDRFILSAGHGSMLLYAALYLLGYEDFDIKQLKKFRQLGARTAGHPEFGHGRGIETTTGPLGQGIANAVGMAIAERHLAAEFGEEIVNHHTYCLVGDGCLMEGVSQEAIALAGHLRLNKLIVLWDDNGITIDGKVSVSDATDQLARFKASGWATQRVDGHKASEISAAIETAKESDKPSLIACKTTIGYGSPNLADTSKIHGAPLGEEEIAATREALEWKCAPFKIDPEILDLWRIAGLKAGQCRKDWEKQFKALDAEKRGAFERRVHGDLPGEFEDAILALKKQLAEDQPEMATRKSSHLVLETINSTLEETLGGSADLTGSNNTLTEGLGIMTAGDYSGFRLNTRKMCV